MATATFNPPEVVQGVTTSWLPLTTTYPSVPGCSDAFFRYPGQAVPFGWDPGYGYFAGGTLRCLPPEETAWHEYEHQAPDGYTTLSIRPIVCPQAFTTAVSELRSDSSTLVLCCPSGYDLLDGQPSRAVGRCLSTLTSGQTITFTDQAVNSSWISTTWAVTTATYIEAVPLLGWNVAPTPASTSSSASSTSPSTSTSTGTPPLSHGLSTGAKAGIGVGAAVGVIGLIVLGVALFLCCCRRRRKPQDHRPYDEAAPKMSTYVDSPPVVYELRDTKAPPAHEMYQNPVELESHHSQTPSKGLRRKELPSRTFAS